MEQILSDLIFALWDELIGMHSVTRWFMLGYFTVTWIWLGINTWLLLMQRGE